MLACLWHSAAVGVCDPGRAKASTHTTQKSRSRRVQQVRTSAGSNPRAGPPAGAHDQLEALQNAHLCRLLPQASSRILSCRAAAFCLLPWCGSGPKPQSPASLALLLLRVFAQGQLSWHACVLSSRAVTSQQTNTAKCAFPVVCPDRQLHACACLCANKQ